MAVHTQHSGCPYSHAALRLTHARPRTRGVPTCMGASLPACVGTRGWSVFMVGSGNAKGPISRAFVCPAAESANPPVRGSLLRPLRYAWDEVPGLFRVDFYACLLPCVKYFLSGALVDSSTQSVPCAAIHRNCAPVIACCGVVRAWPTLFADPICAGTRIGCRIGTGPAIPSTHPRPPTHRPGARLYQLASSWACGAPSPRPRATAPAGSALRSICISPMAILGRS